MLRHEKGNVYSHHFWDIAFEGITGSERLINVLLVRFLPHPEKHGTPSSNNVLQNRNGT